MKKFIYKNEHGHTHVEVCEMGLVEVAAEIGRIAREVYSILSRQDPEAASLFRAAVMAGLGDPDSPVWSIREQQEAEVATLIMADDPRREEYYHA